MHCCTREEINRMSKNPSMKSEQELCHICPSKLSKRELEDLYFSLLQNNLELKKKINKQEEKVKVMSTRLQRMSAAQKNLAGKEKECCLASRAIVNEQKNVINDLKKTNDRLSDRVKQLNMRLCTTKQFLNRNAKPYSLRPTNSGRPVSTKNASTSALNNPKGKPDVDIQTRGSKDIETKSVETDRPEMKSTSVGEDRGRSYIETKSVETDSPDVKSSLVGGDSVTSKLCDENRCRTLMEELKNKIADLQEELSKAHEEYSSRISRLEQEVRELRADRERARGQSAASEQRARMQLQDARRARGQLRDAQALAEDLSMKLNIEKGKVAEMETQLRAASFTSDVSKAIGEQINPEAPEQPEQSANNYIALREAVGTPVNWVDAKIVTDVSSGTPLPADATKKGDDSGYADPNNSRESDDEKAGKKNAEATKDIRKLSKEQRDQAKILEDLETQLAMLQHLAISKPPEQRRPLEPTEGPKSGERTWSPETSDAAPISARSAASADYNKKVKLANEVDKDGNTDKQRKLNDRWDSYDMEKTNKWVAEEASVTKIKIDPDNDKLKRPMKSDSHNRYQIPGPIPPARERSSSIASRLSYDKTSTSNRKKDVKAVQNKYPKDQPENTRTNSSFEHRESLLMGVDIGKMSGKNDDERSLTSEKRSQVDDKGSNLESEIREIKRMSGVLSIDSTCLPDNERKRERTSDCSLTGLDKKERDSTPSVFIPPLLNTPPESAPTDTVHKENSADNLLEICEHHAHVCTCQRTARREVAVFRTCSGTLRFRTTSAAATRFRRCDCGQPRSSKPTPMRNTQDFGVQTNPRELEYDQLSRTSQLSNRPNVQFISDQRWSANQPLEPDQLADQSIMPDQYNGQKTMPGQYADQSVPPDKYTRPSKMPDQYVDQAKIPSQFADQSRIPDQYNEQSKIPDQYADQIIIPSKFTRENKMPGQYAGQSIMPDQYNEQSQTPGRYDGQSRTPDQYNEQSKIPGQYADQRIMPDQISGQSIMPGQYDGQSKTPGQFTMPGQYADKSNMPDQYTEQSKLPGQYSDQSKMPGQYSAQSKMPGQYAEENKIPEYNVPSQPCCQFDEQLKNLDNTGQTKVPGRDQYPGTGNSKNSDQNRNKFNVPDQIANDISKIPIQTDKIKNSGPGKKCCQNADQNRISVQYADPLPEQDASPDQLADQKNHGQYSGRPRKDSMRADRGRINPHLPNNTIQTTDDQKEIGMSTDPKEYIDQPSQSFLQSKDQQCGTANSSKPKTYILQGYAEVVKCSRATSPDNTDREISSMTDLPSEKDDYQQTRESRSPGEDKATTTYTDSYTMPSVGSLSEGELPMSVKNKRQSYGEILKTDATDENSPGSQDRPSKQLEKTLQAIGEELARCRTLLLQQQRNESEAQRRSSKDASSTAEVERCPSVALRRAEGRSRIGDAFTPRCMFTLHIGTVVLSDEAVINSRDISLVLTWQFYDQNVAMTRMRAGRVVHFDFSTEYDVKLTDEFIDYMKYEEMSIVICALNKQDEVFATCSLPLRDALLHTNRRADMSLALVAGPRMRNARSTSDSLDSGDEVGVLDLWCMLRAEPRLLASLNKAIAKVSSTGSPRGDIRPSTAGPIMTQINEDDLDMDELRLSNIENEPYDRKPNFDYLTPSYRSDPMQATRNGYDFTNKDQIPDDAIPMMQHRRSSGIIINEVPVNIKSTNEMEQALFKENEKRIRRFSDESRTSTYKFQNPFAHKKEKQRLSLSSPDKSSNIQNDLYDSLKNPNWRRGGAATQQIEPAKEPKEDSEASATFRSKKYDSMGKIIATKKAMDAYKKVQIKKDSGLEPGLEYRPEQDRNQYSEYLDRIRSQSLNITVLWLALNEECEAMGNPNVQRLYVAYSFLGHNGADLETPTSLPKPKHCAEKCFFNFKKTFQLTEAELHQLGRLAKIRAPSKGPHNTNDCVVFTVVSEPVEDPLGLNNCEDIGYAYLYFGELLAYSAGSDTYTEVLPVQAGRRDVCGVLAVKVDGLDVVRKCLMITQTDNWPRPI